MMVTHDGSDYEVVFVREWHNPPLDGKYKPRRIKQTTTCYINRIADDGDSYQPHVGEAHCSVADRYNFMRGHRLALENAVLSVIMTVSMSGRILRREFVRQVMPEVAKEFAAIRAKRPQRPTRRQLVRALHRAKQELALIGIVADGGSLELFNRVMLSVFDGRTIPAEFCVNAKNGQ